MCGAMSHSSLVIVFSIARWSWWEDFNESGRETREHTPKEGEQCQEKKEKKEDENVKGQTKWEENKERVDDRVAETFIGL